MRVVNWNVLCDELWIGHVLCESRGLECFV